jgi:hypothetical protein
MLRKISAQEPEEVAVNLFSQYMGKVYTDNRALKSQWISFLVAVASVALICMKFVSCDRI